MPANLSWSSRCFCNRECKLSAAAITPAICTHRGGGGRRITGWVWRTPADGTHDDGAQAFHHARPWYARARTSSFVSSSRE